MMHTLKSRQAESGLALVAVLGIVLLLALLATAVLEITRRHGQLAASAIEASQRQEVLDSGLRLALRELVSFMHASSGGAAQWRDVRTFEVFGRSVAVSVQLEAGRVDLNFADRDLLLATFAANDVPEATAAALAARILDWRDGDDLPEPSGGERAEYERAGRAGLPRNGAFETVAELSLLLDAEQISTSLLDAFTVHAHTQAVQPRAAHPSVARALRWADARQLGGHGWLVPEAESRTQPVSAQTLAGQALRLQACVAQQVPCRMVIVRMTGSASTPVQVLAWQSVYQGAGSF